MLSSAEPRCSALRHSGFLGFGGAGKRGQERTKNSPRAFSMDFNELPLSGEKSAMSVPNCGRPDTVRTDAGGFSGTAQRPLWAGRAPTHLLLYVRLSVRPHSSACVRAGGQEPATLSGASPGSLLETRPLGPHPTRAASETAF